ncbi:MAG: DNA topoisomerase IV subunit A, partial [Gammaproteobacteria bacterium]|nr:DNA topoisomerase IV subunit A [Gammaproteobacteria bacterium]
SKGWVRAARGHDIDAKGLNFKSGDDFRDMALGKSNQSVVFIDSNGRSYTLPAHSLPSARGQGEPLTGRLKPAAGAEFVTCLMAKDDDLFLLSTSHGYGFVCRFEDMLTRSKNGKALISISGGAQLLPARAIKNVDTDAIASITSDGYIGVFDLKSIPHLSKGKGNKILGIPPKRLKSGEERVSFTMCLSDKQKLVVHSGKKYKSMNLRELEDYRIERGKRGRKLPRGYQNVSLVEVVD